MLSTRESQSFTGDPKAAAKYIAQHDCTVLKSGDTVVLASGGGVLTIRFRAQGETQTLWAPAGSVEPCGAEASRGGGLGADGAGEAGRGDLM